MGAGKTAIGQELARQLEIPFKDTDHEIELAANMSVSEIFSKYGEPFFREKETQILSRLVSEKPCVLSTGGGAFISDTNKQIISQKAVSVWLDVDLNILWSRVKRKDTRPLLRVPKPFEKLKQLHSERAPHYKQAMVRVSINEDMSIAETTELVVKQIAEISDLIRKRASDG